MFQRKLNACLLALLTAVCFALVANRPSSAQPPQNLDKAIIDAACRYDFAQVKELLAAGANPNAKVTFYGDKPPLIGAASKGYWCLDERLALGEKSDNLKTIKLLLDAGADVNFYQLGTALMWAAHAGDIEAVKILLAAGAKVNVRDVNGDTALSYYALAGSRFEHRVELVKTLLAAGADEASRERALKIGAPDMARREIAKLLLTSGVSLRAKNEALMWATARHDIDIINGTDIIKLLLAAGAEVNGLDTDGRTAVFYAARSGGIAAFNELRAAGADLRVKDNQGRNLLMEIADVPTSNADGMVAASLRNRLPRRIEILKMIIADGLDVNAKDRMGRTALMHAEIKGNSEIAEELRRAGARR